MKHTFKKLIFSSIICLGITSISSSFAHDHHNHNHETTGDKIVVKVYDAVTTGNGEGNYLGTVTFSEGKYGLLITPDLKNLPAGIHGFHIHQNPSCAPATKDGKLVPALAAGGHWDPQHTNHHGSPYSDGSHLGDLPGLVVVADGTSTYQLLAPRIKNLSEIKNHSLMIHVGGDTHSDTPHLGGGGARLACAVIK